MAAVNKQYPSHVIAMEEAFLKLPNRLFYQYNIPVILASSDVSQSTFNVYYTATHNPINQIPTSGRLNVSIAESIAPWHVTPAGGK